VVRFAIETAARQGELCRLDWRDVDLKKATAKLRDTKNGDDRIIPLSAKAVAVLKDLEGGITRLTGPAFGMTESALKQSFTRAVIRARKAYEKACLERKRKPAEDVLVDLHFHDLRHEATSRLAEKLAMHELAKVTGHKDTRMLLRYYHPKAEDLAKKLG
jgi:integrase